MELHPIEVGTRWHEQALDLRFELFFEKVGLSRDILFDGKEEKSQHIGLIQHNQLIAYGRLSPLENAQYQISQMVVAPEHQGKGHGKRVLAALIDNAKAEQALGIELNARITAMVLYESMGFEPLGDMFESASTKVKHIKMHLAF